MKKGAITLNILSWLFIIAGLAVFFLTAGADGFTQITPNLAELPFTLAEDAAEGTYAILPELQGLLAFDVANWTIRIWITVGILGFTALMFIIHFIVMIATRRPGQIVVSLIWLVLGVVDAALVFVFMSNDIFSIAGVATPEGGYSFGLVDLVINAFKQGKEAADILRADPSDATTFTYGIFNMIVALIPVLLFALAIVFSVIGEILVVAYCGKNPRTPKRDYAADLKDNDKIVVLRDEPAGGKANKDEIRSILHNEVKPVAGQQVVTTQGGNGPFPTPTAGNGGPFIIQYINTFGPSQANGNVSQAAAPAGNGGITAAEIRAIIAEEIAAIKEQFKEQAPVAGAGISANEVRSIISDELAKHEDAGEIIIEEEKDDDSVKEDDIRKIIREELNARKSEPQVVVIHEKSETPVNVQAAPAPVAKPVEKPIVKEEPKVEEAPVEEAPVEAEVDEDGKVRPERIPFAVRLCAADKELKAKYNELKNELLAYGIKSRVSTSADTFRLHKETYCKITVAGKALKLYFALDPRDYANTTLPIIDAGGKSVHEETPLAFKVKSELSVRRAKQLIADVCGKKGLEKGEAGKENWAKLLKDYKPQGEE